MKAFTVAVAAVIAVSSQQGLAAPMGEEEEELIRWIAGACPAADDHESLLKLDQVVDKALATWLMGERYREAVKLALEYSACLDRVGDPAASLVRSGFIHEVLCLVPLRIFETDSSVDRRLALACLARCKKPPARVPEQDGERAEWAEHVGRYLELLAAVGSAEDVCKSTREYAVALWKAGMGDPVDSDLMDGRGLNSPVFTAWTLFAYSCTAGADLDSLLETLGGEEKACGSNFLGLLSINPIVGSPDRASLPLVIESMMRGVDVGKLAAMVRKAKKRFKGQACIVPIAVATMASVRIRRGEIEKAAAGHGMEDVTTILKTMIAPLELEGDPASRVKVLSRVVKASPKPATVLWWCALGRALVDDGKPERAFAAFRETVAGKKGEDAPSCGVEGMLDAAMRIEPLDEKKVHEAMAAVVEAAGENASEIFMTLRGLEREDVMSAAMDGLGRLARRDHKAIAVVREALSMVVESFPGTKQAGRAVSTMEEIGPPQAGNDARSWRLAKGMHLAAVGKRGDAKREFDKALSGVERADEEVALGVESLLEWLASRDEAGLLEHVVSGAVAAGLVGAGTLAGVAGLVGQKGNRKLGRKLLKAAVDLGPAHEWEWMEVAYAYALMHMAGEAKKVLKRLGDESRWSARACELLYKKGLIGVLMGEPEAALRDLQAYIDRGCIGEEVIGAMAYALFDMGRYEDAVEKFDSALESSPGCADNFIGMALAKFRLGKLDEAREAMDRAVELEPAAKNGYKALESREYIYSDIQKKAWDDLVEALGNRH